MNFVLHCPKMKKLISNAKNYSLKGPQGDLSAMTLTSNDILKNPRKLPTALFVGMV